MITDGDVMLEEFPCRLFQNQEQTRTMDTVTISNKGQAGILHAWNWLTFHMDETKWMILGISCTKGSL